MLRTHLAVFIVLLTATSEVLTACDRPVATGPLYDYIHNGDETFSWEVIDMISAEPCTTFIINMTSQRWPEDGATDREIWWHYVVINAPTYTDYPDAAFLEIGPSYNTYAIPEIDDYLVRPLVQMCESLHITTAIVLQVPNQPIDAKNGYEDMEEDEIISWTLAKYYNDSVAGHPNSDILLLVPMTKAAVRIMDVIQEFTDYSIERFMVSGASKRGWTTWLTGAVDERVVAIAPAVFSFINMAETIKHDWRALGGWPFALVDYWKQGLTVHMDTQQMQDMQKVIDPYFHRRALTIPKFIIHASSDEFFMNDDFDYFYDGLLGEKHIWMLENSGHFIKWSDVGSEHYWEMMGTYFLSIFSDFIRPNLQWIKTYTEHEGSILLHVDQEPTSVSVWSASSIHFGRRDFRLHVLEGTEGVPSGVLWTESPAEQLGNRTYRASFPNPPSGYTAFFIKVSFNGPGDRYYLSTTDTAIVPNTFPFEDCKGMECIGHIL